MERQRPPHAGWGRGDAAASAGGRAYSWQSARSPDKPVPTMSLPEAVDVGGYLWRREYLPMNSLTWQSDSSEEDSGIWGVRPVRSYKETASVRTTWQSGGDAG